MPVTHMWTKFSVPRYVKVTLPHAALLLLWLVYVTIGAFVFLTIESPNEIALKKDHSQRIRETILNYIDHLWKNRKRTQTTEAKRQWQAQLSRGLLNITNVLYAAFATDYVSYSLIDLNETDGMNKLSENAWTLKSAAFFSTTTVVTIGYGNMVPATAQGRILCILFALFGCPLAIITVGDLGKFLSEFVVHCYNKARKLRKTVMDYMAEWSRFSDKLIPDWDNDVPSLHYEDLILDERGISATIVISILVIYNTIGALIFQITEDWTFMDSFYFCFISITTVGFGDIIPKNDPWYIVVTCYTAVGIGITTMCIDLVGTRYITKLHYFGRKLKGADLMRYLRRKRIRDSRILLAAKAAETIEAYLKNLERDECEDSFLAFPPGQVFVHSVEQETEKAYTTLVANGPVSAQHTEKIIYYFICLLRAAQMDLKVQTYTPPANGITGKDKEGTEEEQQMPLTAGTDFVSSYNECPTYDSAESTDGHLQLEMIRDYVLSQLASVRSRASVTSLPAIPILLPRPSQERLSLSCQASIDVGPSVIKQQEDVPAVSIGSEDTALQAPLGQSTDSAKLVNDNLTEEDTLISEDSKKSAEGVPPILSAEGDQLGQKKFAMPDLNSPSEWPTKLRHNMTFMLEGSSLKHDHTMKSTSIWTCHTYPAKYYFSEDMKVFERVNVTFAKKELVSARLLNLDKRRREGSISARTIGSFSILNPNEKEAAKKETFKKPEQREKVVDLNFVYKVTRTYCFWKTCTAFHCICTKIEPCKANKRKQESYFVIQYVWRNPKESEILKVEQEIRRKELSFVPDFLVRCK